MAKDYLSPAFNQEIAPDAKPEYRMLADDTVMDIVATKDGGSLIRTFAFTKGNPTISAQLVHEGSSVTDLGGGHMGDFDTKASAQAYIKLLQMGGSPFGLRNSK